MSTIDKEAKSFKNSMNVVFGNGIAVLIMLLAQSYSASETERKLVNVLLPLGITLLAIHSLATNLDRRLRRLEAIHDPSRPAVEPPKEPSPWWLIGVGLILALVTTVAWHSAIGDPDYKGEARWEKDAPFLAVGVIFGTIAAAILAFKRRKSAKQS